MLRIGALLEHWADHRPDGLAVVCGAERLDWRTLHHLGAGNFLVPGEQLKATPLATLGPSPTRLHAA